jgi:hypothetical protein
MEDLLTTENIVAFVSFVYGAALYLLPPEKAEKLNVIGKAIAKIVTTPAGLKVK